MSSVTFIVCPCNGTPSLIYIIANPDVWGIAVAGYQHKASQFADNVLLFPTNSMISLSNYSQNVLLSLDYMQTSPSLRITPLQLASFVPLNPLSPTNGYRIICPIWSYIPHHPTILYCMCSELSVLHTLKHDNS